MMSASDVIVIGGGIVGAGAAYAVARAGAAVTLVDRTDQGQATAAGAGIISPATSLHMPDAFLPLASRAVKFYDELLAWLAEDGETETGYDVVGLLHVATNTEEAEQLPILLQLIQERKAAGAPAIGDVELLVDSMARMHFPPLAPTYGAIHTSGGARINGRMLRDAMTRAAERRGARMVQGEAEVVIDASRATGVRVHGEMLSAGSVVLAGGAWSAAMADALGLLVPVHPLRGQILHLELQETDTSRWPIIVGFHSHYLLTFPTSRVVAGATQEIAGFDYRMTAGGVHEDLNEALRIAPGLAGATLHEVRVGLRPASRDGLPLLGRAPGVDNLYIATGHGAHGLQLGPYSGAAMADLALGRSVDLDLAAYSPERFQ
jgi:D-amino-acid dehydrogenase